MIGHDFELNKDSHLNASISGLNYLLGMWFDENRDNYF